MIFTVGPARLIACFIMFGIRRKRKVFDAVNYEVKTADDFWE
jgi:hypothetical protein